MAAITLLLMTIRGITFAHADLAVKARDHHSVTFRSDSTLLPLEAARVIELLTLIADPNRDIMSRRSAVKEIKLRYPHRVAIPTLVYIIRDPLTHYKFKAATIGALSSIDDPSVIPLLIDLLRPTDTRQAALEYLGYLLDNRGPPQRVPFRNLPQPDIDAAIIAWSVWWKENERHYKFDRRRVMEVR